MNNEITGKMDKQNYREVLGEQLKTFREERSFTVYRVAKKGGIRIDQVQAVEKGNSNYTIDVFLGYIFGSDLYMHFAEKGASGEKSHDFNDLIKKAIKNYPVKHKDVL